MYSLTAFSFLQAGVIEGGRNCAADSAVEASALQALTVAQSLCQILWRQIVSGNTSGRVLHAMRLRIAFSRRALGNSLRAGLASNPWRSRSGPGVIRCFSPSSSSFSFTINYRHRTKGAAMR